MIRDTLYTSDEARTKLMSGVERTAKAVGQTMGTAGKNALIEAIERPGHFTTNDGFTIANSIHFQDPLEDMGRKILCEAVNRANRNSGDGSSTTCVLTQAILEEGMKHLTEASPLEIKKSLEDCIPLIEQSIKDQTKEITVDTVAPVASISAEDEHIGALIQEIYQKIGKTGVIQWDISKTTEDSYTIGTGITVNGAKYASRYMCDMIDQGFTTQAKVQNPYVLLARKTISSMMDLNGISEALFNRDSASVLVIFCDDIEPPVINGLVQARQQLGFRTIAVKMPVLWANEWWEDLSVATGAQIVGDAKGIKMKSIGIEHLGRADYITVNKEDTIIEGIKDLSTHLMLLKGEGTDEALQRAERLNTKTARYFVGATSDSALAYKRLKVEDAINAANCALEHGIVPGGGIALLNASKSLPKDGIGGIILAEALARPFVQILTNAGHELSPMIKHSAPSTIGIDSKSGMPVDMFKANIVDAADVVLNAAKNAIGVAASILTISSVVTLPREDSELMNAFQSMRQPK